MGMLASEISLLWKFLISVKLWQDIEIGFLLNRWLYFSDWGHSPKIERIGMDGNIYSRTTIVNENIGWPNGLCLDYDNKKLYWIDAKLKNIFNAELDGSNIRRILHNAEQISHPFSLTVFEAIIQMGYLILSVLGALKHVDIALIFGLFCFPGLCLLDRLVFRKHM